MSQPGMWKNENLTWLDYRRLRSAELAKIAGTKSEEQLRDVRFVLSLEKIVAQPTDLPSDVTIGVSLMPVSCLVFCHETHLKLYFTLYKISQYDRRCRVFERLNSKFQSHVGAACECRNWFDAMQLHRSGDIFLLLPRCTDKLAGVQTFVGQNLSKL